MKNLLNPKWLLVVNTLPIVILYLILASDFAVIKSQLEEDNLRVWLISALALGGLAVVNLAIVALQLYRKKNVPAWYNIFCLVAYIVFIYLYSMHLGDIIPWTVSRWMLTGNVAIYACTFLMPTLAYSLFALVVHLTANPRSHKAWLNFLIMVSVPIFVYLFFVWVLPLWDGHYHYINDHVYVVMLIIFTLLFLFFLVRAIYILVSKKQKSWKKFELLWKIPVAVILPIVGLAVNGGNPFSGFFSSGNVFGDLSSPWFFILAFVNGVLICLPALKNKTYRLVLFIGRSILMAFSFYFFIVFLPYLPVSVLAIIFIGLGFLMLTPLLIFIIHINELQADFNFLKKSLPPQRLRLLMIASFFVIPLAMTLVFLNDKLVLHKTLEYVYKADFEKEYRVDRKSFTSTIRNIEKQKGSSNDILFYDYTPYISSYYKWLVLDNLTLSDKKISLLANIFLGYNYYNDREEDLWANFNGADLVGAEVESTYDTGQEAWHSWVHLDIHNPRSNGGAEYETMINLPDACWITDYYLYVEERKEMGILAEKKAAMWVYKQIRDEQKDPGILHYETGNRVRFKVFPFASYETRRTGIEFLHKEPVSLAIGDSIFTLGNKREQPIAPKVESNAYATYVSAIEKKSLKEVRRKAYLHILIDTSTKGKEHEREFKDRASRLLEAHPDLAANAKVSLLGTYMKTFDAGGDWQSAYGKEAFEGGCFFDRGMKTALYTAWKENACPVIVLLTADDTLAGMDDNYADYKFVYPESEYFYVIDETGNMAAHSLLRKSYQPVISEEAAIATDFQALEYTYPDGTVAYVKNDTLPSVIFRREAFDIKPAALKKKDFQTAMLLQANWWSQLMHPDRADREWRKLADYSFNTRILTPVTSFIVVENEAQREAMFRKQREILSSDKDFDTGSSSGSSRMSEPGLWVLLALVLAGMAFLRYRKRSTH